MSMGMTPFRQGARHIRNISGTASLEVVLLKAVKVLAHEGIPHLLGGGFAVQEHGYCRTTQDLELVVPSIPEAKEKLSAGGFEKSSDSSTAVIDTDSKVKIKLLPGGGKVFAKEKLVQPMPTAVSEQPQVMSLAELLNTKLSRGWMKDLSDVVELIKANSLRREYPVDGTVRTDYEKAWDTAAAEMARAAKGRLRE